MTPTPFLLWDFHAALTALCLVDHKHNLDTWSELVALFKRLVDAGEFEGEDATALREAITTFHPVNFWRCDPGIWQTCVFARSENQDVIAFYVGADFEAHVILKFGTKKYEINRLGNKYFDDHPMPLQTFEEALTHEPTDVPTRLVLWVARGYDTMSKVAQFALLRDQYGDEFAPIPIIRDSGNMLAPVHAFGERLGSIAERAIPSNQWRLASGTSFNVVECYRPKKDKEETVFVKMRELIELYSTESTPEEQILGGRDECRILISFELEKRQFVDQRDFFRLLAQRALKHVPSLRIFVNGMTGYVDGEDDFKDIGMAEAILIDDVFKDLPITCIHLHNKTFLEKAQICRFVDFYVGPHGTASFLPGLLGVPGVAYSSNDMMKSFGWFMSKIPSMIGVDPSKVTSVPQDDAFRKYEWGAADGTRKSYSIDTEYLLDLCEKHLLKALQR